MDPAIVEAALLKRAIRHGAATEARHGRRMADLDPTRTLDALARDVISEYPTGITDKTGSLWNKIHCNCDKRFCRCGVCEAHNLVWCPIPDHPPHRKPPCGQYEFVSIMLAAREGPFRGMDPNLINMVRGYAWDPPRRWPKPTGCELAAMKRDELRRLDQSAARLIATHGRFEAGRAKLGWREAHTRVCRWAEVNLPQSVSLYLGRGNEHQEGGEAADTWEEALALFEYDLHRCMGEGPRSEAVEARMAELTRMFRDLHDGIPSSQEHRDLVQLQNYHDELIEEYLGSGITMEQLKGRLEERGGPREMIEQIILRCEHYDMLEAGRVGYPYF